MKSFFKPLILVCALLLGLTIAPSPAKAANYEPAQVKNLQAVSDESSVVLKWKKLKKATGYNVYMLNTATGQLKKLGRTAKVKFTAKGLNNNTPYTFVVKAYRKVKSTTYEGMASNQVTATPQIKKPSVPKLYQSACSDRQIKLKWKKAKYASGYEVFQQDGSGEFKSIGTVSGNSTVISSLINNITYKFKIRAFRKVGSLVRYGDFSYVISGKPVDASTSLNAVKTMTYRATVKSTINARLADGSNKKVTVRGGTGVTVTTWSQGTCTVKLPNGKKVHISRSNLNIYSCIYNSKTDYSTKVKEDYVNYKGYSSSSHYLIWVSLYHQRLYIFKGSTGNWKLFRTCKCSTGKAATATPKGIYSLYRKERHMQFDASSYADYPCYFNGSAIHSWVKLGSRTSGYSGRWYRDGSLGHPASHGCVRLNDSNIIYLYKQVPIGTTIIMY